MCTKNIHVYRPVGLCGWLLLCWSYIPCAAAVALIAGNILPYHLVFLPYLWEACVEGWAPFHYYYCCSVGMVLAEIMVYGNLFLTAATAPGFVPHTPWSEAPCFDGTMYGQNPFEVRQLDRTGRMRYCTRCEQFKPDDAHHCRFCDRCVFRMDHHCPWVNNCIGRNNTKYFLLFTGYIPVGALHIVLTTGYSSLYHLNQVTFDMDDPYATLHPAVTLVTSITFSLAMALMFAGFATHFLWMALRGETSVSAYVERKTRQAVAAGGAAPGVKAEVAALHRLEAKDAYVYDVFGADTRWSRLLCCCAPVRDARGLPGETMPPAADDPQRLV